MDERDWNEYSPKVVEEKGVDAPGSDKYRASKVCRFNGLRLRWQAMLIFC